jgi:hypothetical protein
METKVKNIDGTNVISDDKKAQKKKETQLSGAIGFSVEVESNFKLFSYRIIDQETFISRIDELLNFYIKKVK